MPNTRSERNKKKQKEITNEKIKTKSNFIVRLLLLIVLCIGLLVIYARYTETSGLMVNEYKVTSNKIPDAFHGIKVIQFSDLHYGTTVDTNYLNYIVKKINELKPDLVIFTGDLIEEDYHINNNEIKAITNSLSKIKAILGKYACIGDEDTSNEQYNIIMKNSNFQILDNTADKVYSSKDTYILINGTSSSLKGKMDATKAFEKKEENSFTISFTHENDNTDTLLEYKPDMILTGHSLGGLIRIPPTIGLIKQEGNGKFTKRHQVKENTEIFNSYGIGTSQIRFRFFNKPSINLYRLTKK